MKKPKTHKLTVVFHDEDDMIQFLRYVQRAKAQEGTVSGLYAGLLCSALKRSVIPSKGI